eukprot:3461461-Pleurochrysis_carterae.AAC.1
MRPVGADNPNTIISIPQLQHDMHQGREDRESEGAGREERRRERDSENERERLGERERFGWTGRLQSRRETVKRREIAREKEMGEWQLSEHGRASTRELNRSAKERNGRTEGGGDGARPSQTCRQ